jgi:tetratricopeptide (TPR) repeat protein
LAGLLTLFSFVVAPLSRAQAALDPELSKPYRLQVVLDVTEHRLLTRVFLDQLRRDLRDLLQADLGDLAKVEVIDLAKETKTNGRAKEARKVPPLIKAVQTHGLEKGLDGFREVSDVKTHIILLRFANGQYQLQARQHDGATGMPSPLVRTDQTTDPGLVARKAAKLVDRDFGLVGTVMKVADGTVELAIKGGKLGVDLDRWVKVNEVFAIAHMTRGGSGLHSVRLPWALLQVTSKPNGGVCSCKFFHRLKTDTLADEGAGSGYRCLKLGTVRAPLRLRLLDFKTNEPYGGLQVHVSETDFGVKTHNYTTSADGLARTEESYAHVAFVRVLSEGKPRAQIPVAMLAFRTMTCLLHINPEAEAEGEKKLRRNRWLRRIYDSMRVAADRVASLNKMGDKSQRKEALEIAREGLKNMEADLKNLTDERTRLSEGGAADRNLAEGDLRLQELQKRRQELDRFVTRLTKIIQKEKDPRRREMLALLEQARLLESQAEFDQALKLYEKILDQHPKETNVRKRYGKLSKAFAVKTKKHGEARAFIYKEWTKPMEPAALNKALDSVEKAFANCRQVHDALAPQKILLANVTHADNLKKRLAALRPRSSEDDRKEAELIAKAAERIKKLHDEVAKYVKEEKPGFP